MRLKLSVITFLLIAASPAFADYIAPGDVNIKTANYQPQTTNFAEGTYYYDVSWQGIKVGSAQVEVRDQNIESRAAIHVTARAQTAKFISVFYRLRHTSESVFDASTLRPHKFVSYQKENSNEKVREIVFDGNGEIKTTGLKNGRPDDEIEFHSDNMTLDPISAAFVARSLPVNLGEKFDFDVFSGKHRYLVSFCVEAEEKIRVGDKSYDAYRVVPSVQKLTDSEGEKRFKSAILWVSADPSREVLKLESSVLIGRVSARLNRFVSKGEEQKIRAEASAPVPPIGVPIGMIIR